MYWLIDLAVILLIVLAVVRGVKKGFFNGSFTLIGFFIMLALSVALTAVFVLLFYKLGAIDQLTFVFAKALGETGPFLGKIGVTTANVAYYISLAIVAIICFIVSYIIVIKLCGLLRRGMESCRDHSRAFRIIDSTIGVVVNLALVGVLLVGVFGFFHAFNTTDMFTSVDEALRACPISGLLYNHNPVNSLFADMGFAEKIVDLLNANF